MDFINARVLTMQERSRAVIAAATTQTIMVMNASGMTLLGTGGLLLFIFGNHFITGSSFEVLWPPMQLMARVCVTNVIGCVELRLELRDVFFEFSSARRESNEWET